jgi:hypothetical protein
MFKRRPHFIIPRLGDLPYIWPESGRFVIRLVTCLFSNWRVAEDQWEEAVQTQLKISEDAKRAIETAVGLIDIWLGAQNC